MMQMQMGMGMGMDNPAGFDAAKAYEAVRFVALFLHSGVSSLLFALLLAVVKGVYMFEGSSWFSWNHWLHATLCPGVGLPATGQVHVAVRGDRGRAAGGVPQTCTEVVARYSNGPLPVNAQNGDM